MVLIFSSIKTVMPTELLFAMKMSTYKVLFVLVAVGVTVHCQFDNGKINKESKKSSLFIESFKKLQREPPVPPSVRRAAIKTEWIDQKLDHFDENETRTWKMRYMVNDEHFKEGGPMFIMLGGEWEITPELINSGHFYDMAYDNNAILFYTEHRYYGESKPTRDLSVENIKFLNAKQALADLAHFIHHMRETNPSLANAKVIMAGGSYSASMVVWFKRLYPELLNGGWASSAPILAKVDFKEFKEVVGQAMLELGSQQCYNRIQNGINELESMFANKRGAEAKAMMKLCNNFNEFNDMDLWLLFGTISNLFSSIVQYQREGEIPFACDYLMQFEDDATAIAAFLLLFVETECVDVSYKTALTDLIDTSYIYGATRPWLYQTCNEYGWFQTSASNMQPFGKSFPVTLWTTMCADVFGNMYTKEQMNKLATQTNIDFGGMNPEVENIYMTHGSLDPWHRMGLDEEQGAIVIPNASHCNDFNSISNYESIEMRQAKERLANLIKEWLKE